MGNVFRLHVNLQNSVEIITTVVYCPNFHVKWECRVPFSLTHTCTYACAHTNAYTLTHTDVHTHMHTHTPLTNSKKD